ncbi:MAG: hypothetical protein ACE1ZS_03635, partial [Candidatus Poribacteria bacterium]
TNDNLDKLSEGTQHFFEKKFPQIVGARQVGEIFYVPTVWFVCYSDNPETIEDIRKEFALSRRLQKVAESECSSRIQWGCQSAKVDVTRLQAF